MICVNQIFFRRDLGGEMGKAELNKIKKLNMILDSAFDLFTSKGVENTSIAEISEQSGVAKGTFYLYFRDKHELRNRLVYHKSSTLFKEASAALDQVIACKSTPMSFEDKLIFIIDFVINKLEDNKILLAFISKNLSWGVFKKEPINAVSDSEVDFKEIYYKMLTEEEKKFKEPEIMLFMIIELVNSTAHSAILYNEPADMETIKPYLFDTVRAIIKEHEIN